MVCITIPTRNLLPGTRGPIPNQDNLTLGLGNLNLLQLFAILGTDVQHLVKLIRMPFEIKMDNSSAVA